LNFGHTVGHALEQAGHYSYLKHGEAVLYGMIAETHIAHSRSMISTTAKERIERLIAAIELPKLSSLKVSFSTLIGTMLMDKKAKEGKIRMVLPSSIGKVSLPIPVSTGVIRNAVNYLKEYAS
ncbi:MAG: 3-dehydroquinate synthase, partial [Ignavibacteriales bacterium]|nr:3-dehydroquinate synthase [Ignavibacteriales bacterium]